MVGAGNTPDWYLDLPPGVDSMVREQVHRLQSRVDVLEQVRLGWEWVWLVSTGPTVPGAVVPNCGMVGGVMGKGYRDSGFLTMPGSTVWESPGWEEQFKAHLGYYTRTLISLIRPQAP